jgi:hypothetical protein
LDKQSRYSARNSTVWISRADKVPDVVLFDKQS